MGGGVKNTNSSSLNQILFTYSVNLQKARNAKTKLSLAQGPRFSFFDPLPFWVIPVLKFVE